MGTIHNNAVRATQTAKASLDRDLGALTPANQKLLTLTRRKAQLELLVVDLKGKAAKDPKKYGAALKEAAKKRDAVTKDFDAQIATVKNLSGAVQTDAAALKKAKDDALAAGKQDRVPDARWVDSIDDAGSLSPARQRALLGAETGVSTATARARDVKVVQDAVRTLPPAQALKVLDRTLMGTDEPQQAALLASLAPQLTQLAGEVVKPFEPAGSGAAADAYLEALRVASPEARKVMVDALAAAVPSGRDWKVGLSHIGKTGLGSALTASLEAGSAHVGTAGEVTAALMKAGKTDQAAGVRFVVAERARALRHTFEAKEKTAQKVRGELALLNQGVGALMDEPQRMRAIGAFKAEHQKELDAFDKAAGDYGAMLEAFEADTGPIQDGRFAYADNLTFSAEMEALRKHLPSITTSPEGEKVLIAGLAEQAKGAGPGWLRQLADTTKTTRSLATGTANVIAMGIAQLGAKGSLRSKFEIANVLQNNAKLLGIEAKSIDKLAEAFSNIDASPESTARLEEAFEGIKGGTQFGHSDLAKHSLKLIGIGLSAYGLAKGVEGWNEADALARVKTVVSAASLGVDGTKYALELLGKEGVAKKLSRFGGGGVAVVTGFLDGLSAYDQFKEGNLGAGVGTSLSAAGSLLMGAASISESIPGGQLIGAGLAVAGLVTNLIVGSREKGKQERASEKDARTYLVGGGVDPAVATPLSNVRQTDHRNAGVPIRQIAERLGMTGDALFKKLQKLPPAKVDQFVKRMLDLELEADGTVKPGPLAQRANEVDSARVTSELYFIGKSDALHTRESFPRSLHTATEWTRQFLRENGAQ